MTHGTTDPPGPGTGVPPGLGHGAGEADGIPVPATGMVPDMDTVPYGVGPTTGARQVPAHRVL